MKLNLTKLVAGAAALTVAGALVAGAAHAAAPTNPETPPELANYQVVSFISSDACGFQVTDNKRSTLGVVYSAKEHATALVYTEQDAPDLSNKTLPVTLNLDKDQYDMNANGENGGIMLLSTDDSMPAALIAADVIRVTAFDQPVFGIASDKQFDDAMEETVVCSQTHK
jgi:hypothetical protein